MHLDIGMQDTPEHIISAILCGFGIAALSVIFARVSFRIALRQSSIQLFLHVLIGSMIMRTALALAATWHALTIHHCTPIPMITALLAFYLIGLGIEIAILHCKQARSSQTFSNDQNGSSGVF
ncbi:MAG: hypothetical protein RML40_08955 [Bacteroidota bacterium]|nr:hypothetical protein [Candidatus Kapabacteria bacterium]MDW8220646.1 hypothetical protein [Bacteroidota bacterium]